MYKENMINNSEPGKFLCSGHSGANGNTLLNCNRTHKAATSRITTAATTTTTTTIKITTITLSFHNVSIIFCSRRFCALLTGRLAGLTDKKKHIYEHPVNLLACKLVSWLADWSCSALAVFDLMHLMCFVFSFLFLLVFCRRALFFQVMRRRGVIYATRALATIKQDFFLIESLYGAHSTKLCYKTVTALSDVVNDDDDGDDAAITSTVIDQTDILKTIRFNYKNVYGHSIISAIVPVLIDRQVATNEQILQRSVVWAQANYTYICSSVYANKLSITSTNVFRNIVVVILSYVTLPSIHLLIEYSYMFDVYALIKKELKIKAIFESV
uniref:Uncharacterized protein n=1 Tax=Glossina palpalis gambiensis TaxID=67801 RepID=A0A1B0AZ67_9MUSC